MARALLIAFSCCPDIGSEPGIGWNFAAGLARTHDVTLLTNGEFRRQIDAYLAEHPEIRLQVIYKNGFLPRRAMLRHYPTANIYYYLWQLRIAPFVRGLHRRERFDIIHHVNWGRYWMPAAAAFAGAPFVWGPVGAAESAPRRMLAGMSLRSRISEFMRDATRWIFERDPLTAVTARRAACAIAATRETAEKLRRWGVRNIAVIPSVGVSADDLPGVTDERRVDYDFISVGRLLDWKGFHLGLRAFAAANIPRARYAIVGSGPGEGRLRRLVAALGIDPRVDFLGHLPRAQCLQVLSRSRTLVHPSLHDSGGFVLVEAMALGKPVICLDIGGPAVIVDQQSGIKIGAHNADDSIKQIVAAMRQLHTDKKLYEKLSRGAFARGQGEFLWTRKMQLVNDLYAQVLNPLANPCLTVASDAAASTAPARPAARSTLAASIEKSAKIVA